MNSYFYPLLGGILIGLSSSFMLLNLGRMTGISGILFSSVLDRKSSTNFWRYSFIIGLLVGGVLMNTLYPSFFDYKFEGSLILIVVAGLIVGYGTRLGSGCTSGHGVCGLPRKSIRSLVATITFMFMGIITVFIKGLVS
jgi:uncharacterized membrane protein YedE/YeeE